MQRARHESHELRREPPATNGRSSSGPGPALMFFCLLVALTPLVFAATLFDPYTGAKEVVVQMGTATVVLTWLVTARLRSWSLTPMWVPLIAVAVLCTTSALLSSYPAVSIQELRRLLPYFLLFVVALHLIQEAEARVALTTALMFAGAIEGVYVLLQFAFGDPIFLTEGLQGKWQTFGTLGNPNWTGEFLSAAALITLGRLIDLSRQSAASRWSRHGVMAALILMLVALMATLARGAWLGFVVGLGAMFLVRRGNNKPIGFKWRQAIAPMAIAFGAAVVIVVLPLFTRPDAVNHLLNLRSVRGRIWIAAVTGNMIRDAPWLGHGLGAFRMEFPLYQARAFAEPWSAPFLPNASFTSFAHNDHLQIWAELGVIGLLAFAAVIWIVLKRGPALAADPVSLGYWAAVISLLVNAAIAFPLHLPTSLMLFVVFAAAVEAAACKAKLAFMRSPARRVVLALFLIFACVLAYNSGYQHLAAQAAFGRAEAALQTGDPYEAEMSARTAIRHAPASPEGYALLGRLYLVRGQDHEAIAAFEDAMKLGFDADVFEMKATALERTGQISAAVATMNELVRLRPDLESARQRLTELNNSAADAEEDRR